MSSSGGGRRKQTPVTVATPANPAAGTNFGYSLPSGGAFGPGPSYPAAYEIVAVRATFTTSAAAANRLPFFYLQDAVPHVLAGIAAAAVQVASTTVVYSLLKGVTPQSQVFSGLSRTEIQIPLPSGIFLPAGGQVWSYVNNIQAGDQWSGITVSYDAAA